MIDANIDRRGATVSPRNWVIAGMLLVAFALYLFRIDGQSIWRDEALSVVRARQSLAEIFSNRNIVDGVESPDAHPPLYFLILHGWRWLLGESEFSIRFLSLVFMVLALAMMFSVGQRIWGYETGFWTCCLALLSPFFLWYAKDARMYTLIALESLIFLHAFWPLLQDDARRREYFACSLAALLLLLTHYSGVFLVAFAVLAYCAVRLRHRFEWRILLVPAAVMIPALFLLLPYVNELFRLPDFVAFSRRPLWTLAQEAANTFSLGSSIPVADPGWRLLPFIALGAIGAVRSSRAVVAPGWRASLVGVGSVTATLLLFYAASWLKPIYSNPRHLTIISSPWYILMGHGLAVLWQKWRPMAVSLGILCLLAAVPSLNRTIDDPPMVKDDVRSLVSHIRDRMRPGDLVLWHDAIMKEAYDYYALDLPARAVPHYGEYDAATVLQELSDVTKGYRRVWFVEDPAPIGFDETIVKSWFESNMVPMDFATFPASWASLHLRLYQWPQEIIALPANAIRVDQRVNASTVQALVLEDQIEAGEGTWVSLLWSGEGSAGTGPNVCLYLRDSSSVLWVSGCAVLSTSGSQPSRGWRTQLVWLPVPPGLAPVTYVLELAVDDIARKVGTLEIAPSRRQSVTSSLAQFESGLHLLAIEWESDAFRAGLWAVGDLLWRTESRMPHELQASVRFVDWLGRTVAQHTSTLGPADYPNSHWRIGETVRSFVGMRLPTDVDGLYRAQISVTDSDGTALRIEGLFPRTWTDVGFVRLQAWPMLRVLPDSVENVVDDVFLGEKIRLAAYEITREDSQLGIKLYWLAENEIAEEYSVFVHVGRLGEPPLAQSSGGPANWTRPTTSWRKREFIEDLHTIQLPPDLDVDSLVILVGMYESDDPDVRLPILVGGRAVDGDVLDLGPLPGSIPGEP